MKIIDLTKISDAKPTITKEEAPKPRLKIVISEILFNPEGSDLGKEFIKLYNPNDSPVNLKNWSLKASKNDVLVSIIKIGGSKADKTSISSHAFFLIGFNNYSAMPPADAKRSASLINTSSTIHLYNDSETLEDALPYSENTIEGQSVKRNP